MGNDLMNLTGRVAVVTGGGRGIGREISRVLGAAGASIAIAELDASTGEDAATEIRTLGREAIAVQTDVRRSASVESMVQQVVQRLGKIDILVNNAGTCINTPAETTKDEEWLLVVDLNLNGVFWCCRAAGQHMLERKTGSIVNIASMSGSIVNKPQPQAAYNASKAAVIHLTKSLAAEWASHGVRVNSVSPGYIGTEMTKRGLSVKEQAQTWLEMTPMSRIGTPNEVALAVWFLASDASSFTTGSDLIVDGGYTAW
ncbi:MAG TPA: glucose 1-dehydrogenase [Aggregatilineales bacterium]|nr:glucose 1-dehydrogenase [Aggregatilineales bacterium]